MEEVMQKDVDIQDYEKDLASSLNSPFTLRS